MNRRVTVEAVVVLAAAAAVAQHQAYQKVLLCKTLPYRRSCCCCRMVVDQELLFGLQLTSTCTMKRLWRRDGPRQRQLRQQAQLLQWLVVVGELLLSLCGALLHRPKWRIGTTIYQIRELNITDLPVFKVYSFFTFSPNTSTSMIVLTCFEKIVMMLEWDTHYLAWMLNSEWEFAAASSMRFLCLLRHAAKRLTVLPLTFFALNSNHSLCYIKKVFYSFSNILPAWWILGN